jgi:hypothetical protein
VCTLHFTMNMRGPCLSRPLPCFLSFVFFEFIACLFCDLHVHSSCLCFPFCFSFFLCCFLQVVASFLVIITIVPTHFVLVILLLVFLFITLLFIFLLEIIIGDMILALYTCTWILSFLNVNVGMLLKLVTNVFSDKYK